MSAQALFINDNGFTSIFNIVLIIWKTFLPNIEFLVDSFCFLIFFVNFSFSTLNVWPLAPMVSDKKLAINLIGERFFVMHFFLLSRFSLCLLASESLIILFLGTCVWVWVGGGLFEFSLKKEIGQRFTTTRCVLNPGRGGSKMAGKLCDTCPCPIHSQCSDGLKEVES